MLLLVAALTLCSALPLLYWSAVSGRPPAHAEVVDNLILGSSADGRRSARNQSEEDGDTLRWERWARRSAPARITTRLERQLVLVGRSATWPLHRLLIVKLVLAGAVAALCLLYIGDGPSTGRMLLGLVATGVAYFAPGLLLHSRGQERQQRIQHELADTLDQITISVEAGLAFDTAMARTASNGKGPLAEELVRTLQDIQVGVPRRTALRALADRSAVSDLRRFVAALLQADAYGIPLADVLRTQSAELRRKRRQRAEEKAMQIPVKVVFPLILCILPTLFIVLLGPAALDIVETFSS